MNGIYESIRKGHIYARKKIKTLDITETNKVVIPEHLHNSDFVGQETLNSIKVNPSHNSVSFSMFGSEILINISKYGLRESVSKYLIGMISWLHVLKNFLPAELNIYLYLLPHNKKLTEINPYSPDNVNSGYSYYTRTEADIVIFRKEEWFKVFLHETFHSCHLDFAGLCACSIKKLFKIKSEYRVYESYTECWARLINCIYHSYYQKKRLTEVIREEVVYSIQNAAKVLAYTGHSYRELFNSESYREDANVFCYYVLTAILLYRYDAFINWCQTNNEKLFKYIVQPDKLVDYMKTVYREPELIRLFASKNRSLSMRMSKHRVFD